MECPQCQYSNPPGTIHCVKCATPLGIANEMTADGVSESWSAPARSKVSEEVTASPPALEPGKVLGGRYEIVELLGEGGMGAVYKARDRELDRLVALKVIHPELARNPQILQRFKQELILARQITHKNVIRIFDLGAADGIKFITMEYVEGQDLKSLLRQGQKFTAEDAAGIIQQVCRALNAAHVANVVHRDLKPQNIMLDKQGKVLVMDFGIARSMEMSGLTQTGTLMGTPEYMSPEQAKGEEIDARSDLFTLGVIFYELLVGKVPFQAETPFKTMLKRTQERAVPPIELNPGVPAFMNDVVMRCLEVDPQLRYQSALEILKDLEARQGTRASPAVALAVPRLRLAKLSPKWIASGLAVLVLVIAGIVFRQKILSKPAAKQTAAVQPISLAILPFRNASGDSALDWLGPSLAEMLATDVGQSAYLRTVSSDRLHQILHDLRISADSNLDPDTLRRVAEFTNADRLVWGQYAKFGDQIRIDATLQDLKRQRAIPLKVEAPNEKELLPAIAQLAQSIQQDLALSSDIVKELQAKSLKPSSKSIQALRYYSEGLQLAREGKNLEAVKKFETSTKEDAEFALAYAKLGQIYAVLGYDNEAEQASRKAVDLSEKLPTQEKYLIAAIHAQTAKDNQKAIESYENLAKASPNNSEVQFTLGGLYEDTGSFDKAREDFAKVLKADPKNVVVLFAMGRVQVEAGNPQAGLDDLNRALTLAIEFENQEQRALILQVLGVAYQVLKKPDDALGYYHQSLEIKRRLNDKRGIADSYDAIAQVQASQGKPEPALRNYLAAIQLRREIGDKKRVGDTLMNLGDLYNDLGQYDQVLETSKEALQIVHEAGDKASESLALNNIGNAYLSKGQYEDGRTYFEQALQLRQELKVPSDIAATLHNLGETSLNLGEYDQALTYYLRALEFRRTAGDQLGEAEDSDSLASFFSEQGQYGRALKAQEDALRALRQAHEGGFWLAAIMSDYGRALSQVGRFEDAQKALDEALQLAREIKNQDVMAWTLNLQGDRFFCAGDYHSAARPYEEAMRTASQASNRLRILQSKFNLAKLALRQGRFSSAIGTLRGLAQEADILGARYLSVESSVYLAEALLETHDYSRARSQLERAVARSEKMGLRALLARSHYLMAKILRLAGNQEESQRQLEQARQILSDIRKEAGDSVMKRSDLAVISRQPS